MISGLVWSSSRSIYNVNSSPCNSRNSMMFMLQARSYVHSLTDIMLRSYDPEALVEFMLPHELCAKCIDDFWNDARMVEVLRAARSGVL